MTTATSLPDSEPHVGAGLLAKAMYQTHIQ